MIEKLLEQRRDIPSLYDLRTRYSKRKQFHFAETTFHFSYITVGECARDSWLKASAPTCAQIIAPARIDSNFRFYGLLLLSTADALVHIL